MKFISGTALLCKVSIHRQSHTLVSSKVSSKQIFLIHWNKYNFYYIQTSKMAIGDYPADYNPKVHGPYDPARYYGKGT